jgi:hypothetical protein
MGRKVSWLATSTLAGDPEKAGWPSLRPRTAVMCAPGTWVLMARSNSGQSLGTASYAVTNAAPAGPLGV